MGAGLGTQKIYNVVGQFRANLGPSLRSRPTKILCGLALSGPFVGHDQMSLRGPHGIAPLVGVGPVRGPQNTVYWVPDSLRPKVRKFLQKSSNLKIGKKAVKLTPLGVHWKLRFLRFVAQKKQSSQREIICNIFSLPQHTHLWRPSSPHRGS